MSTLDEVIEEAINWLNCMFGLNVLDANNENLRQVLKEARQKEIEKTIILESDNDGNWLLVTDYFTPSGCRLVCNRPMIKATSVALLDDVFQTIYEPNYINLVCQGWSFDPEYDTILA